MLTLVIPGITRSVYYQLRKSGYHQIKHRYHIILVYHNKRYKVYHMLKVSPCRLLKLSPQAVSIDKAQHESKGLVSHDRYCYLGEKD